MPKVVENKASRQRTLLRLLREESLCSQDDVVRRMNDAGFPATQPCISRDFRELGVVKLGGKYVVAIQQEPTPPTAEEQFGDVNPWSLITELRPAGPHMLVARTKVGAAALIATQLDQAGLRDIVGTIAGDDTVFIAVPGEAAQRRLEQRLRGFGLRLL